MFTASNLTRKLRRTAFAVIATGALMLAVTLVFGAHAIARINATQDLWKEAHQHEAAMSNALAALNRDIGYGGFIHNFKNLVLRRDLARYQDSIKRDLADLQLQLDKIDQLVDSSEDQAALAQLRLTFGEYAAKFEVAAAMVAEGKSSSDIDAVVKVSDTAALAALAGMTARFNERALMVETRVNEEQAALRRFLQIGGLLIFTGVVAASTIMILFLRRLMAANDAIRKTEAKLDRLLETAPDPMLSIRTDGRIVRVNRMAAQFFGYPAAELTGMKIEQLIPERHRAAYRSEHAAHFKTPGHRPLGDRNIGLKVLTRDGREPVVEVSFSHFGEGEELLTTITVRDVTERRQSEEKARDTALLLDSVIESLPVMLFLKRASDLRMVLFNRAGEEMLGFSRNDLVGKNNYDNFPKEQADFFTLKDLKVLNETGIEDIPEEIISSRDGRQIVLHTIKVAIKNAHGKAQYLLGISEDITQQQATRRALAESEARFKDFTDTASDWVWESDADFRFSYISDSFERTTGIKPRHLLGKTRWQFADPANSGLSRDDWLAHRAALEDHQPFRDFRYRARGDDGSTHEMNISGNPVFDTDGNFQGYRGTGRDITKLMAAQRELMRALDEAKQANLAKSAFLSSMSHELRTPLNAILGFGQVLEADPACSAPDQQESIKYILSAGHQLLGLINDVLDLSRIDSGNLDISLHSVGIADIASTCVAHVTSAHAQHRDITVENLITDPALAVQGDKLRVQQVLINLLSNAVKYNKKDGRVSVSSQVPRLGWLRIEVRDTGHGIASEQLPQLFSPFERLAQKHGTISGVGIGLHITKQLVEAMHGTVGVESALGKGSTFWFELPLAGAMNDATVAPAADKHPIQHVDARFVLLYIDDNPVNIKLVSRALRARAGIELLTAGSAEEGMTIAEEVRPDLILMDIQLPGLDGIAATTILKASAATQRIPVVALSANAMQEDIDRALNAGCSGYLTKPINVLALYELIDRWRSTEQ